MKIAAIYARYSSDRQTEQSIEGQLRVCQEYAQRNNIVIVNTYIDRAMTGTNDNREEFQRMLNDSDKKEWDFVLVYKLDRFSRNKYETAIHRKHLKDNGIKLISAMEQIPDSPEGILLESLLEGMNQYYSEELSQKTKRGMHETRLKGNFIGGLVNYGYTLNENKVELDPYEAPIILEIFTKYANGETVRAIIDSLHERGLSNRGKPFKEATLYRFLRKEKYTGIYRVNGCIYDKIYPQIVPIEIYNVVHRKIEANKHGKHPPDTSYLLKNLVYCGECGKKVTSYTGSSRDGTVRRYYRCSKQNHCGTKMIKKDTLENIVLETLHRLIDTKENRACLIDAILEVDQERNKSDTTLSSLQKDLLKTNKSLTNIMTAIESGIFTDTTRERLQELETIKRDILSKIEIEKSKKKNTLTRHDIEKHFSFALKQVSEQLITLLVKKIIYRTNQIELYLNYTNLPDDAPIICKLPEGKATQGVLFTTYTYSYTVHKGQPHRNKNTFPTYYEYEIVLNIYI